MGNEVSAQRKLSEISQLIELMEYVSDSSANRGSEQEADYLASPAPWGGLKLTLTRCRTLVDELGEELSSPRVSASLASRMTQVPRRNTSGHVRELRSEVDDSTLGPKPESP